MRRLPRLKNGRFFASMKGFLRLFFSFFVCFCLVACTTRPPDTLAYLNSSFCAELEGTLYGSDFCARIEAEGAKESGGRVAYRRYTVSYLAPEELAGIRVEVLRDPQSGEAQITASLGEISLDVSHESVGGWLLPVESLLSLAAEEPESLQKTEVGYRVVFPGGKILTVDEKGLPISLQSPEIDFSVREIQLLD